MSSPASPFGMVPVQVAMDPRLTLQQMRVLLALYTFRNKTSGIAHPTREEIGSRTGMAICKISTATTDLERLGWLKKVGNGGRSQATRYLVNVPETVTDQVTVTSPETVTDQVTVTSPETVTDQVTVTDEKETLNGYRIGNETVTDSVRGIEQTIQTINTNTKGHPPYPPASDLADPVLPDPATPTPPSPVAPAPADHPAAPQTPAGTVCKAMKAAGLQSVNPSSPMLTMLIEAGASTAEFEHAAADAVRRGKPFAYALQIVVNERKRAAEASGQVLGGAMPTSKSEALRSRNQNLAREWAEANEKGEIHAAV